MKKSIFITLLLFVAILVSGQEVTGDWYGTLKVQSMQLRLVFHISKTDAGFTATMDSPDQGAKDIPLSKATFENQVLSLELNVAKIQYTGTLDNNGSVNAKTIKSINRCPCRMWCKIKGQSLKNRSIF